ncbi:hypothetical protein XaFJ1_GM003034 [Xanthomonas albilineans]|nr:hypothetical protein XaFJ1_GM003034 [Xanthomonas albilineans]
MAGASDAACAVLALGCDPLAAPVQRMF